MNTFEQKSNSLGIELGSTRIKAVLAAPDGTVLASGAHDWQNRLEGGYWTYHLDDVWAGIQDAYAQLKADYRSRYGQPLQTVGALGVSAMMHGYLPFDKAGHQLAAFRTWRNTTTLPAATALTERFHFNIPQRWSIAHLYQAILNGEEHVRDVAFLTTLAGYVHWQLTGKKVLGIGDASGVFPIDSARCDYDAAMLASFDELLAQNGLPYHLRDLLPTVLCAGQDAGSLTEGRPLFVRRPDADFTLANFARAQLYACMATLKIGLDILFGQERVTVDDLLGHGGLFKVPVVGQKLLAGALGVPVSVMQTAGEGGPWGMALLAGYRLHRQAGQTLEAYLRDAIFANAEGSTVQPDAADSRGFAAFLQQYTRCLVVERAAADAMQ